MNSWSLPPALRKLARCTGIRSVLKLLYADTGFIVDFETLEKACAKSHETLDHNFLNEIPGLETPSLENISRWIWQQLAPQFARLHRVTVRRDSLRQCCSYFGED